MFPPSLSHHSGIYRITVARGEKPPKYYIGQAKSLRQRKIAHLSLLRRGIHQNSPLQSAFNKYGEARVSFEILLVCDPSLMTLYEQVVLDSFAGEALLNIHRRCVASPLGRKHSEETKQKMSLMRTGIKMSDDARAKISAAQARRYASVTERLAVSERMRGNAHSKGHVHSDETRRKIAVKAIGRSPAEDVRAAISLALKGKSLSEETRAKMRLRRHSEETRRKMRESQAARAKRTGKNVICVHCGCEYYSPPSGLSRTRFCSMECKNESREKATS